MFNFKIGPSLDISWIMLSIFIIRLIIRIIKTLCFHNTILMAELEGKLPWNRWSISAPNSPNSGYFHKIFGMHLNWSTSTLKMFYHHCYFWIYNPPTNGQIVSLIGAQVHLQIKLLRTEWYRVLKILRFRISPTK